MKSAMTDGTADLAAQHRRLAHAEEVCRTARLLLVRAAMEIFLTQSRVARELGMSQSAVCQQLSATKLPATRRIPRQVLLPAAEPAISWLAGRRGFEEVFVADRCWHPQEQEDLDVIEMLYGAQEAEHWMEPQVDLFLTVPEDRSDSEVLDFVGTVERLLRRGSSRTAPTRDFAQ